MFKRVHVVPAGHGSRWLDPEMLERVFERPERAHQMQRTAEPTPAQFRQPVQPLRYRPFEGLEALFRSLGAA
jgi:hypothetical protein